MKIIKRLIVLAICMFIPLILKLVSYSFYKTGGSIFLQHNAVRADIVDADGVLLATTIPTQSVYIVPIEVLEQEKILNDFPDILNVSKEYIKAKLNIKSRKFGWLLRHIAPWQARAIENLGYSGVYIANDIRRFYPLGSMFNHIIGRVDDENNGISGINIQLAKTIFFYFSIF